MGWKRVAVFIVLSRFEGALGTIFTALNPADANECGRTNLTWIGGKPPYAISLLANSTNGYSALGFANILGTSFVTRLPFPSGQQLEMLVRDSTGAEALSSPFVVQPFRRSSKSCLLSVTPVNRTDMVYNQTLKITSPTQNDSIFVCDNSFTVDWQGGQPPYNLLLQSANRAIVMEQAFGGPTMDGGSVNTRVQLPPGFDFQVIVVDNTGTSATTGVITLANGGKQNCVISSDATKANGASFAVSGPANASAIVLPTPTQRALLGTSSSATPSITANPKQTGMSVMSVKTVAIVAPVISVAFLVLCASVYALWRARRRRNGSCIGLLSNSSSTRNSMVPPADFEKYRLDPYYLPALPPKGTTSAIPRMMSQTESGSFPAREFQNQNQLRVANPDAVERRPLSSVSSVSRYTSEKMEYGRGPRYSNEDVEYSGGPRYPNENMEYGRDPRYLNGNMENDINPRYPNGTVEYDRDDDFSRSSTPVAVVGPTSWEDEKAMMR